MAGVRHRSRAPAPAGNFASPTCRPARRSPAGPEERAETYAAGILWWWPVVPDSPLSALLFALTLLPRLRDPEGPGDARSFWVTVARMATLKYGLWTVLVLGGAALRSRTLDAEAALLLFTHAGMAVEAWRFLQAAPPAAAPRRAALAWLLFNDACDYGPPRTHPRLPDPAAFPYVAAEAVALSLLAAWAASRGGRTLRDPAGTR